MTDRTACDTVLPVPMAMATGAVHHALVRAGLRTTVGLVRRGRRLSRHASCRRAHRLRRRLRLSVARAANRAFASRGDEGEGAHCCKVPSTPAWPRSCRRWASPCSTATALRNCSTFSASMPKSPISASPARLRRWAARLRRHRSRAAFDVEGRAAKLPTCPTTAGCASAKPTAPSRTPGSRRRQARSADPSAQRVPRAIRCNGLAPAEAWSAYTRATDDREPAVLRDLLEIRPAGPAAELTRSRAAIEPRASASSPAPCRSARSAPRRTRPSPSP